MAFGAGREATPVDERARLGMIYRVAYGHVRDRIERVAGTPTRPSKSNSTASTAITSETTAPQTSAARWHKAVKNCVNPAASTNS